MFSRNQVLIGLACVAGVGLMFLPIYGDKNELNENNWKMVVGEYGTTLHGIGKTVINRDTVSDVKPYLSYTCKDGKMSTIVHFHGSTLSSSVHLQNSDAETIDISFGSNDDFYMEVTIDDYEQIHVDYPEELFFHMKQTQKMYDDADDFQVITQNKQGMSMVAHFDVSEIVKVGNKMREAGCDI